MDAVTGSAGTLINEDPMETLKHTCTLLHEELRKVREQVEQQKRRAECIERNLMAERSHRVERVVVQLVNEAKGTAFDHQTDVTEMWKRLVELVSDDDHECWSPTREYLITATYTVKVSCYATAQSEDEAREKFDEANVSLDLSNKLRHQLDHLDIEEIECESLEIELN